MTPETQIPAATRDGSVSRHLHPGCSRCTSSWAWAVAERASRSAGLGFGIWTMLPIRDGRSRSLDGQGLSARWRRFRIGGVDASAGTRVT